MSNKSGGRRTGGLGRGLGVLFEDSAVSEEVSVDVPEEETEKTEQIRYLDIESITPNGTQPRRIFDEQKLEELAASIREHGLIQPLIVRPSGSGYEIVAGERRWRAAKMCELTVIPCIVREFSDRENMLMALIENMQREDLTVIEEAEAFHEMMESYGLTHEEVSKGVGKSRPYITNALRLLRLPEAIQAMVTEGRLSGGHARVLAGISDEALQMKYAEEAADGKMSVRQLEKLAAGANEPKKKAGRRNRSPEVREVENRLTRIMGANVHLPVSRKKGKIEIAFRSGEQREKIIEMLLMLEERYREFAEDEEE